MTDDTIDTTNLSPTFTPPPAIDEPKVTAAERLRAFEDKHLGEDTPRHAGAIERGHGSPFTALHPDKQREYAALERLVEAEKKVEETASALAVAETAHAAAKANLENLGG